MYRLVGWGWMGLKGSIGKRTGMVWVGGGGGALRD